MTVCESVLFSPLLLGCETLTEWEYLPPVGPRPNKGFVGLKNAGATCYMNSVIQQLYMIPSIRNGILAIEGTGTDVDDDMSGDEKQENEVPRKFVLCPMKIFQHTPSLYAPVRLSLELRGLVVTGLFLAI